MSPQSYSSCIRRVVSATSSALRNDIHRNSIHACYVPARRRILQQQHHHQTLDSNVGGRVVVGVVVARTGQDYHHLHRRCLSSTASNSTSSAPDTNDNDNNARREKQTTNTVTTPNTTAAKPVLNSNSNNKNNAADRAAIATAELLRIMASITQAPATTTSSSSSTTAAAAAATRRPTFMQMQSTTTPPSSANASDSSNNTPSFNLDSILDTREPSSSSSHVDLLDPSSHSSSSSASAATPTSPSTASPLSWTDISSSSSSSSSSASSSSSPWDTTTNSTSPLSYLWDKPSSAPTRKMKNSSSNVNASRIAKREAGIPPVFMYQQEQGILEDVGARWASLELVRLVEKDIRLPDIIGDSKDPLIHALRGFDIVPDMFPSYLQEMSEAVVAQQALIQRLQQRRQEQQQQQQQHEQQDHTQLHFNSNSNIKKIDIPQVEHQFILQLQQLMGAFANLSPEARDDDLNIDTLRSYLRVLSDCLELFRSDNENDVAYISNNPTVSHIMKHVLYVLTLLPLRGETWSAFEDALFLKVYLSSNRVRGSDLRLITAKEADGWRQNVKRRLRSISVEVDGKMAVKALLNSRVYRWNENRDLVEHAPPRETTKKSSLASTSVAEAAAAAATNHEHQDKILSDLASAKDETVAGNLLSKSEAALLIDTTQSGSTSEQQPKLLDDVRYWLNRYCANISTSTEDKIALAAYCMRIFLSLNLPKYALSIFTLIHERSIAPLPPHINIPIANEGLIAVSKLFANFEPPSEDVYQQPIYRLLMEVFAHDGDLKRIADLHPLCAPDLRSDIRIINYLPTKDAKIKFYFGVIKGERGYLEDGGSVKVEDDHDELGANDTSPLSFFGLSDPDNSISNNSIDSVSNTPTSPSQLRKLTSKSGKGTRYLKHFDVDLITAFYSILMAYVGDDAGAPYFNQWRTDYQELGCDVQKVEKAKRLFCHAIRKGITHLSPDLHTFVRRKDILTQRQHQHRHQYPDRSGLRKGVLLLKNQIPK